MSARFDWFVVFAAMRTGSNFLEASLNRLPGLRCFGEAFNPVFIGQSGREEMLGLSLADRAADPFALIERMRARVALPGFRFFEDHDPRVFDRALDDPLCAKIVLSRNPVDSYISRRIARATGQWKLTDVVHRRAAQATFDAEEFTAHMAGLQGFYARILRRLQVSGQTAFWIDYEDVGETEVLNGLAAWLGIDARLDGPDPTLKPQNPEGLDEKVANFPQMEQALARLDRFNLTRTPAFEPRRGPAIPGYLAARGAPVLFMPVPGGPEATVQGWLTALGGAPEGGFTQKTLRDWKRAHPGHRSFTVLRHPLKRAHAVFERFLAGEFPVIAQALRSAHGLALPPPDGRTGYDADAARADFLAFLRFLKANLAGQTGLRVDPAWATQSAVVSGFAGFALPDHVLREEALADGLARIAAEVGAPPPLLPVGAEPAPAFPLDALADEQVAAAVRAVYARDYMMFGYGDKPG